MYFLARQRETIARTLEPTRELDSRNVSGPLTDRRPCCRDHTLSSRSLGFMSMQVTQSLGFMSMRVTQSMEVSILNILSIHTWTWLLLFCFTHFCSNPQFLPPPHIGKSALLLLLSSKFGFEVLCTKYRWAAWKMAGNLWKSSFTRTFWHTAFEDPMKIVAGRVRQSWDLGSTWLYIYRVNLGTDQKISPYRGKIWEKWKVVRMGPNFVGILSGV